MIGTIAEWRAYAVERGDSAPTDASDPDATAALVRASDYITHNYVRRFLSGYDETSLYVDEATYEAASLELATVGFFSKTYTPADRKVLTEVKGIKWTPISGAGKKLTEAANATPVSTAIEAMLGPYMPGEARVGIRAATPNG